MLLYDLGRKNSLTLFENNCHEKMSICKSLSLHYFCDFAVRYSLGDYQYVDRSC